MDAEKDIEALTSHPKTPTIDITNGPSQWTEERKARALKATEILYDCAKGLGFFLGALFCAGCILLAAKLDPRAESFVINFGFPGWVTTIWIVLLLARLHVYYVGRCLPTNLEESMEAEGPDGRPNRFEEARRWWRAPKESPEARVPEAVERMIVIAVAVVGSEVLVVSAMVCMALWPE
jgi:hypothetical protein